MTITLTREEAQQVLELITNAYVSSQLAETLRARLAQPEPEPVAWFIEGTYADGTPSFAQVCETDPEFYVPLYTAPPQREWQGLTDEEIKAMRHMRDWTAGWTDIKYAREIEAKLKEKNT